MRSKLYRILAKGRANKRNKAGFTRTKIYKARCLKKNIVYLAPACRQGLYKTKMIAINKHSINPIPNSRDGVLKC